MKKLLKAIDYFFYIFVLSWIPFYPGMYLRRKYLSWRMGGKNFGTNVTVGEHVVFGSYKLIKIEDNVTLTGRVQLGYAIGGKIIIKKNALVGHEVLFINNMHEHKNMNLRVQDQGYIRPFKNITVGAFSWIGARAIILPGVKIGKHSIVGAGAVVTKDIPDYSVAAGVPAKVIKKIKK